MKTALKIIAILITLMLLTQCVEELTSPITAVGGVVKDANGLPVVGAKVTLLFNNKITDEKGAFYYDNLVSGDFEIKAEKEGYLNTVRRVKVVDGQISNGDIALPHYMPCGDPLPYGSQTYHTVQIGDQCWLKENLNIGTKINIATEGFQQTNNSTIEKYCYNNDESNCDIYGGLYEWTEAMQYVTTEGAQGICPEGWHIPTYAEMQTLQTYVGNEAAKLVDQSQPATAYTPNNETGFSALFAGARGNYDGNFGDLSYSTYFWSSTENGSGANVLYLYKNYNNVRLGSIYKDNGFSVRCLKD